jgi:CheY-like chemotaxis protein
MLTVLGAHARFVRDELAPDSPAHADLDQLDEAVRRASALTGQLLVFSRRQPVAVRPVVLDQVVQGLERMLARTLGEDVEIVARYGAGDALVLGDPGQLEQVVVNLAVNARDAMPHGGALVLETVRVGATVRLSVTDTGCGMDAATQGRVFEPFFTTKAPGKGTGLGLATVYGIVAQSGGEIQVRSAVGRGTTFEITLPMHQLPPTRPLEPATRVGAAPRGQGETVLLVEDEAALRATVTRMLHRQGYQVVAAAHGGEALARWRELGGPAGEVPLVLSDITMPVMGGQELVAALLAERPAQRVLLMTGYTDRALPAEAVGRGVVVLEKPFAAPELAACVRETLDRPAGGDDAERAASG